MSSTNRDDLEDVFLSAGGARGAAGGGGGGGGGGGEGGGGAASTVGGSGVGSSGGGGGGSVYNNRPTSSFALDPPHVERQSPLLGVASGSGSGSGRGSGSSGGAGSSGDSGGKAGTLPWQQQVFGWVYALHASLTFCDMFLPTAGMCGQIKRFVFFVVGRRRICLSRESLSRPGLSGGLGGYAPVLRKTRSIFWCVLCARDMYPQQSFSAQAAQHCLFALVNRTEIL